MAPARPKPPDLELVILVGLPASGKSSLYRHRFEPTHELVSKDKMPNVRDRPRRQRTLLTEALGRGASVVLDNTNASLQEREEPIAIAKAHGARVVGYYFPAGADLCRKRNRRRTGKACVPDIAISVIAGRLVAPRYAEGFDELFEVEAAGGQFQVQPVAR